MTIKDIAALAGVSITTVSMVLSNKADSISEETQKKVLRIVKEYNFRPYAKAIQNTSVRSGLVGLLIPGDVHTFSNFVAGAQEAASAEGYSLIPCSGRDEQDMKKHLNSLYSRSADGVAMLLTEETDLETLFAGAPEKLVYTAVTRLKNLEKQCVACCAVSAAAAMGTEYLIAAGHKEIALLGWKGRLECEEFVSGYTSALYRHNLPVRSDAVCLCTGQGELEHSIRQIGNGGSTAFFCQDYLVAVCVYRFLGNCGLRIPKDRSVVCMSDGNAAPELFTPELAAVDFQYRALGYLAIQELIARIEGRSYLGQKLKCIRPKLRPGASVAPPQRSKRIVVVGSMKMDIIIPLSHLPTSSERLLSSPATILPGGKGANQSVVASKLGGDVYAIGCLGDDQEGHSLYYSLVESGVNTTGIQFMRSTRTGKALIFEAKNAESAIIFSNGANGEFSPDIVEKNVECFQKAEFCLLSTEIPWETVLLTIDLCVQNGVKIILKPTIQTPIPTEVLKNISFLIPNEKELAV